MSKSNINSYSIHSLSWMREPNGFYGVSNATGHWDGMVGALARKQVDVAVAGLAINYDRAQSCDFLHSVLEGSSTLIVRNPAAFIDENKVSTINFAAYLLVFMPKSWALVIVTYFCLFIVAGLVVKHKARTAFPWTLPLQNLSIVPAMLSLFGKRRSASVHATIFSAGLYFTVLSAYYNGALT